MAAKSHTHYLVCAVLIGLLILMPTRVKASDGAIGVEQSITQEEEPRWLSILNHWRTSAGLQPVTENPEWSNGNYKHALYMVRNPPSGLDAHSEDPNNPWFTAEGDAAARSSILFPGLGGEENIRIAMMGWLATPYHGSGMINPALSETGFGTYRDKDGGASGLDVARGLGGVPTQQQFPILWPPNGSIIPFTRFWGAEVPDPLEHCPGYRGNPGGNGFPLSVQWERWADVSAHSFQMGETELEHCVFRTGGFNSVAIMPKDPLIPGQTYTASMTSRGHTAQWSFSVGSLDLRATDIHLPDETQFAGTVAQFSDADPFGLPHEYSVSIDWGQGWESVKAIRTGAGAFSVQISRTFGQGVFPFVVRVSDIYGRFDEAEGLVSVGGPFECAGRSATVAGSGDSLRGSPRDDVMVLVGGSGGVSGRGGDDLICASRSRNMIVGGDGADTIFAGGGSDIVRGGVGDDALYGGNGTDLLVGGGGTDVCEGGPGPDELQGCER